MPFVLALYLDGRESLDLDALIDHNLIMVDDGPLGNSYLSESAQEINDNRVMSLDEKMEKLHELFSEEGHTITFELKGEQVYPTTNKNNQ